MPDSADTVDILLKNYRNAVWKTKAYLPPRPAEDIITFLEKRKHRAGKEPGVG